MAPMDSPDSSGPPTTNASAAASAGGSAVTSAFTSNYTSDNENEYDGVSSETAARIQTPVAIVGMACRLPGHSNSPSKLWDLLLKGGIASNIPPETRFSLEGHYDGTTRPRTMKTPGGMFMEDVEPLFSTHSFSVPADSTLLPLIHSNGSCWRSLTSVLRMLAYLSKPSARPRPASLSATASSTTAVFKIETLRIARNQSRQVSHNRSSPTESAIS